MATIQVREVPEQAYEVLRRRVRKSGQSLQSYMRDQVVALAERPTNGEAIEQIEAVLGRIPHARASRSILDDLAAERR